MKAYPKYDLRKRTVTFLFENGMESKRQMNKAELVILSAARNEIPGIEKFANQLNEPVELVKRSCILNVTTVKINLTTGDVVEEDTVEHIEYWDLPSNPIQESIRHTRYKVVR